MVSTPPRVPFVKTPRIVVVGAGIAALTVARETLSMFAEARRDVDIVLLEGRSRTGGRIHTFRLVNGANVELGAQIITGFEGGNPLKILSKQTSLQPYFIRTVNSIDCLIYDASTGKSLPRTTDIDMEKFFNNSLDQVSCTAQAGTSLGVQLENYLQNHKRFSSLTPQHLRAYHWHISNLEFSNGAHIESLDAKYWNQDETQEEFKGLHSMVIGGFSSLCDAILKGGPGQAPLDVKFNQRVSEIEVAKNGLIKVKAKYEYEADVVVVTVPLGVLKSRNIKFVPDLPDWKWESIDRLGYGFFNKVILVFPEVFWPDVDTFGIIAEHPEKKPKMYDPKIYSKYRGRFYIFWNLFKTTGLPVLVGFCAGKAACDMEKETDDMIVCSAIECLQKIFPNKNIGRPLESVITRWGRDEFSKGTYSFVATGSTGEDYEQLRRPISKKIFFAGEATCREYP
ncbi:hypothetical protein HK096_003095, partial [Nowakowskiella sp. JEL0078]